MIAMDNIELDLLLVQNCGALRQRLSGNDHKEDGYRGRVKRGRRWDESLVLSWRKYKVFIIF